MVAKKKPTFAEYEPMGSELTNLVAYKQAATALDRAGMYADETKDVEQLTQIAVVWLEIATRLTGNEEEYEEEEGEVDLSGEFPLGFASPEVDAEVKRKKEENGKHKS